MKPLNHFQVSLLISLTAIFMQSNVMAAANFQFIQHASLIGHNAGADGLWGTADDDNPAFGNTTTGSASYAYATGVFINYYSGSFSLATPLRHPGSSTFESMSTSAENGRIGSLKLSALRTLTYTGRQTFVSAGTTSSSSGDFSFSGVAGFFIINRSGFDDPSVFGNANITAHFNLMKTLVPANWTVITFEFQAIDGNYPANGENASSFSTDADAIPDFINVADSNGDGKSDIFWRNSVTNENKIYIMNGSNVTSEANISIPATAAAGWEVVGNGDFNGDVITDILWRNSATGQNHISLMNGSTIPGSAALNIPALTSSQWKIAGVGDFNNDGNPDIFWHHDNGENRITFMNGTNPTSTVVVNTIADTNWKVAGIADINNDGNDDVLWRNDVNRRVWLYLMNGSAISNGAGSGEHVAFTSDNWDIEGFGDFDSDGRGDILWRHNTNGRVWMYLMNGSAVLNGSSEAPGQHVDFSGLDWDIQAVGDYNGDGTQDIFWRNSVDGRNHMFLMSGATVLQVGGVSVNPLVDLNWSAESP